jgi:hypothetical protein
MRKAAQQAGLYPLANKPCYITGKQIVTCNKEAVRLGFNCTLDIRAKPPDIRFPIAKAYRHVGHEGVEQIRLMFFYWLSLEAAMRGDEGKLLLLDITPDAWAVISKQRG